MKNIIIVFSFALSVSNSMANEFVCHNNNENTFSCPRQIIGDTTYCLGDSALLSMIADPSATYQWYYNYSVMPGEINDYCYAKNPGIYTCIVNDICGIDSAKVTVLQKNLPVVNLGNDTIVCADSIILDAQHPGSTYFWTDNSTNQTLTVITSGMYDVTVTDTNNCSGFDTITITINPPPIVDLGPDTILCKDVTPLILDAQNGGNTFLWNDNSTNQTLSVTSSGTYYVTVTDGNSCSKSDTLLVTVLNGPLINLGADTVVCGDSLVLDAHNAGSSYLWADNSTTQTITVTSTGTYDVMVTDTNSCVSFDTISVTLHPIPVVTFIANPDTICENASVITFTGTPTGGTWSGTGITSSTLGTFSPPNAGVGTHLITYTYVDVNSCSNSAIDSIYVDICTGIDSQMAGAINLYPNPVSNLLNVDLSGIKNQTIVFMMFDITGRMIINEQINGGKISTIDLITINNGVYYAHVVVDGVVYTHKIIVNR